MDNNILYFFDVSSVSKINCKNEVCHVASQFRLNLAKGKKCLEELKKSVKKGLKV